MSTGWIISPDSLKHLIIVQDQIKHAAYIRFFETHVEFGV